MRESCSFPRGKLTLVLLLLLIPIVVFGGALLFQEKHYAWIALCVALLSCLPLFICFERKGSTAKELTTLGRPGGGFRRRPVRLCLGARLKPVTAITVIAAMYLGREAGFVVGPCRRWCPTFISARGPGPPSRCSPGVFWVFWPGFWLRR